MPLSKSVTLVGASPLFGTARAIAVLFLGMAMVGCFGSSSVEQALEDYHTRLSRVLSEPLPPFSRVNPLSYPSIPNNMVSLPTTTINLREFSAIQHCELGLLIAQRNTTLGKTQLPSQRLVYEQNVLAELIACEKNLTVSNPELAQTVGKWRAMKQGQYQQAWINMMQSSDEIKAGLSRPSGALEIDRTPDAMPAIGALSLLTSMSNPSLNITSNDIETQLQVVYSSRLPAKVWYTQKLLARHLTDLTSALTPLLSDVACNNGNPSEKATILRNVFYLFFIQEIQPVGSKLNHYHYELAPLWDSWINNPLLNENFKQYIRTNAIDSFLTYQQSMQDHVILWQNFLSRCNLSPQAPV